MNSRELYKIVKLAVESYETWIHIEKDKDPITGTFMENSFGICFGENPDNYFLSHFSDFKKAKNFLVFEKNRVETYKQELLESKTVFNKNKTLKKKDKL
mgnify:FL=1